MPGFFKPVIAIAAAFLLGISLAGCGTNPATGQRQFTALMSTQQEAGIGAEEHQNILRQFGGTVKDSTLQSYVTAVGQRVAKNTERADVSYQFFVLDSPVVNAFALPGGYVYVTRGLLALANSEAQLAAVLAHEIGHVTARHAAERYSHGLASSLGAAALGAAIGGSTATQMANLGSDLYITSYSRKQESQADELGVRYLYKAGYDPQAMPQFLTSLARYSAFEGQESGAVKPQFSYFSTHPQTDDRAADAAALATGYPANATKDSGQAQYLHAIDGLMFGDSADQGFVRGHIFWHPQMGFTFTAPDGFIIINNADQVVVRNASGSVVALFDSASNPKGEDPMTYLTQLWMKGEKLTGAENITINGKPAATADFPGAINKTPVTIRLLALQWSQAMIFRFQIAMPQDIDAGMQAALKRMSGSLRPVTVQEQQSLHPYRLKMVMAGAGDTVASLSRSSPLKTLHEERFRALNGLSAIGAVTAGQIYKTIAE